MKKSIKLRLIITFMIVIVCCVGSILLFNSLFLENIYINEKKNIIKKSYYALDNGIIESYKNGYELSDLFTRRKRNDVNGSNESNLYSFLRELQENYNVSTVLMDADNNTYSIFQNNNRFDRKLINYIFKEGFDNNRLEILEKTDNYTIVIATPIPIPQNKEKSRGTLDGGPTEYYENRGPGASNDDYFNNTIRPRGISFSANRNADIECFGFLSDNQTAFFLTIPVSSLKEPLMIFNKSLIFISLFILIIGSIVIYFVANNLTKPLLLLSELSRKMSRLQFENKYTGKSEDEIGILGNSMNEMSTKLEKAIKEIKNANIQLKNDLKQKEELDVMRQEFVANVSHELKTPIALIEGYAEGLSTPGIAESEESRDYYISVIKDETYKMSRLVKDLLDLSALERGAEELDIERINLCEIVTSVLKTFELKLNENGIKVNCNISDSIYIWADGYKVEQVIRNYISNAINHIDDNKIIIIDTEELSQEKLRFSVYNSGNVLNDVEIEKIWEKFYKVDKSHTREYGGTGLGLSIVKAIAKAHGTTCGATNYVYNNIKGMKFYFDFNVK